MTHRTITGLALSCMLTAACGDEEQGEGTGQVRVYGEAFIEEGIPASEISDGWEIRFERFLVSLADIKLDGVSVPAPAVPIDLTVASTGMGQLVGETKLAAGDRDGPSFTISQVEVAGMATKAGQTKRFDWRFTEPTHYAHCETTTKVPRDGVGVLQITVHADHLFYDSLVAEEPAMEFQPYADADSNQDGAVTGDELWAADLGDFDPGNDDEIDSLWTFQETLVKTLGHVDGEGHCQVELHTH